MTGETATASDGMHPTEMHSCLTNEIKGIVGSNCSETATLHC